MKRQLDRLKGKRFVTGDPNLMTKDEICINATPNGVEVKEIGVDGKIKDLAGSKGGGGEGGEVKDYKYYRINNLEDEETMSFMEIIALFTDAYVIVRPYLHLDTEFLARIVLGWSIRDIIKININGTINYPNGSDQRFYPIANQPIEYVLNMACEQGMLTEITKEEYYSYNFVKYEDIKYETV